MSLTTSCESLLISIFDAKSEKEKSKLTIIASYLDLLLEAVKHSLIAYLICSSFRDYRRILTPDPNAF